MAAGFHRNVSASLYLRKRPFESDISTLGMVEKRKRFDVRSDPEAFERFEFKKIGSGLANLGNTCFLNSVLQCLTYTEPLAAYFRSGQHKKTCWTSGFCAVCAIQNHVVTALASSGRVVAPYHLVKNLRCISMDFCPSRQEDAHEYMVQLMESMHRCSLPPGIASESPIAYEKSLVHKIFGGRLRSRIKCPKCSYSSNTHEPFLDLSLQITHSDSLWKALSEFTAAEQLEVYHCDQCKGKVKALKQLTVDKAPDILAVHLKRFNGITGEKINKKVDFGRTLDLKPFMSSSREEDTRYTLYGVLVHAGHSTQSGHYFCFIRTSTGIWHALDDSQVYQVGENYVLGQKAYMLFYVRNKQTEAFKLSKSERQGNDAFCNNRVMHKDTISGKEDCACGTSAVSLSRGSSVLTSNISEDGTKGKETIVAERTSLNSAESSQDDNLSLRIAKEPHNLKCSRSSEKSFLRGHAERTEDVTLDTLKCVSQERHLGSDSESSMIRHVCDDGSINTACNDGLLKGKPWESRANSIENSGIISSHSLCHEAGDHNFKSYSYVSSFIETRDNGDLLNSSRKKPTIMADNGGSSGRSSFTPYTSNINHHSMPEHLTLYNASLNRASSNANSVLTDVANNDCDSTRKNQQKDAIKGHEAHLCSKNLDNDENYQSLKQMETGGALDMAKNGSRWNHKDQIVVLDTDIQQTAKSDSHNLLKDETMEKNHDKLQSLQNSLLTCQKKGNLAVCNTLQSSRNVISKRQAKEKRLSLPMHYSSLSRFQFSSRRSLFRGILRIIQQSIRLKVEKHFRFMSKKSAKRRSFSSKLDDKSLGILTSMLNHASNANIITSSSKTSICTDSLLKSKVDMLQEQSKPKSTKDRSSGFKKPFASHDTLSLPKLEQDHVPSSIESNGTCFRKDYIQAVTYVAESSKDDSQESCSSNTAETSGRFALNVNCNDISSLACIVSDRYKDLNESVGCSQQTNSIQLGAQTNKGLENPKALEDALEKGIEDKLTERMDAKSSLRKNDSGSGLKKLYDRVNSSCQHSASNKIKSKKLKGRHGVNVPAKIY